MTSSPDSHRASRRLPSVQRTAPSEPEPPNAVKTWRYLRLAMVGVVIGLGVAVLFERGKVHPGCWQTSISAYFYTPVRGYFVAALVGIGLCLVCLRGSTATEDMLLNLAGMLAPIVAFVPTPKPKPPDCSSMPLTTSGLNKNVANNVTALLIVGALALAFAGYLIARHRSKRTWQELVGYGVAIAIWLATTLVFALARRFFIGNAHYTAAILMFLCIGGAAVDNAFDYKRKRDRKSLKNRYIAIASAMGLSSLVIGILAALGWKHATIAVEVTLISLFAVFWVTQTWELRNEGLRLSNGHVDSGRIHMS